ncbi:MAG TPA: ATP-binding protein [Vicinamibacterales bacterium]|jgi:PAS domain S-box-containing protein
MYNGAVREWHRRRWLSLSLAVAGALVAWGASHAFPLLVGRLPFAPFMIVGGLLTLYGGREPGLLMALLGLIATTWMLDPPVRPIESVGAALISLPTIWFIDGHRRAVRALHESERRYQHLCELSSDVILNDDLEGRIVSINGAGPRLGGYVAESMIGRRSVEFVLPESHQQVIEARRKLLATGPGGAVALEVNLRGADGSTIVADVRTGLAVSDGRVTGFHTVVRDITDRRRLEEQLRQGQKMEAIGRLAGGVAHDFNNLLTAIVGFSDIALDGLGANHPQAQNVRHIMEATDQASQLVRQLLAFSRRQVLQPVVLDPNEAVAKLGSLLQRLIGSGIALDVVLDPRVGRITADPSQLTQVLMNLAVNARDAMPEGGRLTMTTRQVTVPDPIVRGGARVAAGSYVVVAVADTGCGMDQGTQARIFEPFFTTKPEGEGTGLGLATVYGIVKQSGGYIWVDSEPGRGTQFELYFPCTSDAGEQSAEHAETATIRGSETVLVAEDDPFVLQLAVEGLLAQGYRVLGAADGAQALALAHEHLQSIDLVLADVAMPALSGLDLVDRIRQLRPAIKVLFMSGHALPPSVSAPFLWKPFTPHSLARALRTVLDGAN